MKALVCEMCGSQDLVKTDGMYVCQNCGTKYTVEEAKKMMIEGTVNVVGTVAIDNSGSYDRIIELARDAYSDKRFDAAYDYYCQAVDIRQDVIENILRQGLSIIAKEKIQTSIPSSCTSRVDKAIDLIKKLPQGSKKNETILAALADLDSACSASKAKFDEEISNLTLEKMGTRSTLDVLADLGRPQFVASQNQADDDRINRHNAAIDRKIEAINAKRAKIDDFDEKYKNLLLDYADKNTQFTYWYKNGNVAKIIEIYPQATLSKKEQKALTIENNYVPWAANNGRTDLMKVLIKMGSNINSADGGETALFLASAYAPKDEERKQANIENVKILVRNGVTIDPNEKNQNGRTLINSDTPTEIRDLLIEKEPKLSNIEEKPKNSGGCYVATCVYGSYDCPQVWTLRRFRDNTLAETWYGRAFIHVYYAVSPTLVKWFGHTSWFKKLWKGKLDHMVENLNADGVEDTPYNDKVW